MLTETSLTDQLAAAAEDPLRVLVVGAGVAGSTTAQLLRRRGLHPVLVERAGPDAENGYMLALMPLVDDVIDRLDLRAEYEARSTALERYRVRGRSGSVLREYPTSRLAGSGSYRGISRGELLRVLHAPGGTVTHSATVTALEEHAHGVRATIRVGAETTTADVDLVVAADGMRSRTRGLVGPGRDGQRPTDALSAFDTRWDGWVVWTQPGAEADVAEELWGTGFFLGSYPVQGRAGLILCGPRAQTAAGVEAFAERVRPHVRRAGADVLRALDRLVAADERYHWPLDDVRAATWAHGRVVLVGDAAAGFLPTAGIGAAMAMESAGVLDQHLAGVERDDVAAALRTYERAQRPRVRAAHDNSRSLARLLFREGRAAAVVRDVATRLVPLEAALRPILSLLAERPVLDPAGAREGTTRPGGTVTR